MKCIRAAALLSIALGMTSCARAPQELIDTALSRVASAAKNADIVTYAPDSLRAAQEKLDALRAEIAAQGKKSTLVRNYEITGSLAREVAEAAARSAEEAATAKRQVRDEASALLASMSETILDFERRIAAARRVRGIKLDFASLADAGQKIRAALADAQKDFDAGSYAAANAKARTVQVRITTAEETISESMLLAKKR